MPLPSRPSAACRSESTLSPQQLMPGLVQPASSPSQWLPLLPTRRHKHLWQVQREAIQCHHIPKNVVINVMLENRLCLWGNTRTVLLEFPSKTLNLPHPSPIPDSSALTCRFPPLTSTSFCLLCGEGETVSSPQPHISTSAHQKKASFTSFSPKDILQNTWPVLLKTVKVIKTTQVWEAVTSKRCQRRHEG